MPLLWPEALLAMARCSDDLGGNLIYRREDGSTGVIVSPGFEAAAEEYNKGWWKLDVRYQRSLERGYHSRRETITDRDVVSEAELETEPFYCDFLASFDLRWAAMTTLCPDPLVWVGLTIQRSASKQPFDDAELAQVSRLCRHAENALRLGIRLLNAEITTLALGDALARLDIGVFLIDGVGRVTFCNPAAKQLLGDALVISDGRLATRFAPERAALDSAIAGSIKSGVNPSDGAPHPILLRSRTSDRVKAAYVLPARLPSGHIAEELMAGIRAIVLVTGGAEGEPPDPALLRDLLGLTLAEARIASLVGSGAAPREAAEKLGIQEETARTALKRVFAKTGVSRQSELAALLARLVLR